MADRTPPINATGAYELISPFAIDSNKVYRCEAIDGFEALAERNIDVFAKYYNPHGLSHNAYEIDRRAGINIVTLMSDEGPTVNVPSSYILTFPIDLSIPHSRIVLSIDLGIIADSVNLDALATELLAIAADYSGKAAQSAVHRIPLAGVVSKDEATQLEAARLGSVVETVSHYTGKLAAEAENVGLKNKIGDLEAIIIAQQP